MRGSYTLYVSYTYNTKRLRILRKQLRKNQTDAEKILWRHLRAKQLGFKFLRQYSVGGYILDFYCAKARLGIEIDGGQHNDSIFIKHDQEREKYLNSIDIRVIRFWNHQVITQTQRVLDFIYHSLTNQQRSGNIL